MNLLIVTNHFWPENFRINDLARGLRERGHEVSVLTGLPNYPEGKIFPGYGVFKKRRESTEDGIRICRVPLIPRGGGGWFRLAMNYISSAVSFSFLAPFLCRDKYDAIFVFETSPVTIGLPAIVLKKLRRIPVAFWVLDLWPESLSATGAVKSGFALGTVRRLVRMIYRNCDEILVSSRGFESSIRDIGGYDGEIRYFPNWVEPEIEGSGPDAPPLPEGFRIVFTGNIGVAQDFETVIDAADRLRERRDIHWVIVGDGRRAAWVKEEVERRGLSANFHLLGRFPADHMPGFYSAADALLLPLRKEPIFELTAPGKLQSYLASGKPIIAALDGEGARLVTDSGGGIACSAQDPAGIAESVMKLYNMSAEERSLMGRRGREYCLANFDRDRLFDELDSMLGHLAKRKEKNSK